MRLGTLFKTKAEAEKDRVFLCHENTRRTYAELFVRVRSLAVGLIEQGLKPGDRAALCLPNCPEFIYSREVEEGLASHPEVLESAVVGIPHRQMADYKCPCMWQVIPEMPKVQTGEILKAKLFAKYRQDSY